jgi:hypothetical protein
MSFLTTGRLHLHRQPDRRGAGSITIILNIIINIVIMVRAGAPERDSRDERRGGGGGGGVILGSVGNPRTREELIHRR